MSIILEKSIIENAWENRTELSPANPGNCRESVEAVLAVLDSGELRVAEKIDGQWVTHQWLKQAILLSFRLNGNKKMNIESRAALHSAPLGPWWDKVPTKFQRWTDTDFKKAGFRAVPGSVVRRGAFIGKDVVLMPSFVNIGAYVGEGTMVDTWATVGSCAQIGKNCHISGGAGIGGVLEPLQANPTIIEDGCFIGARSEIAEGVIVETGSVLGMGVYLGASTKIIDRETGQIYQGRVPAYSVVVPGSVPAAGYYQGGGEKPSLYCAVIVKTVDAQTRAKTGVNELLRE